MNGLIRERVGKLPQAASAIYAASIVLLLLTLASGSWAGDSSELQPVLARARALVQDFAERLGYIRYDETVVQEKLRENGNVQYKQETVLDSIMLLRFNNGELRVEESRLLEKRPSRPEYRPLIETSGFSTLAMVFHPYYESSFQFARIEDDVLDGKRVARVIFEQIPGKRSPALYQMFSGDKSLALSGTAWIDPDSGIIYRIEANVGSTLEEMGLKILRAELHYAPMALAGSTGPQWLPESATIDLETPRQHWRNIHRFGGYRQYSVDVKIFPQMPQKQ